MSKPNPELQGRICQASAWEMVQQARLISSNISADLRERFVAELLQPEDQIPVKVDNQPWARRQCERCGMVILRSLLTRDGENQIMIDVSQGMCIVKHGLESIQKYPLWQADSQIDAAEY